MGLEMIVAIRQFDIDRGQEVNMRVGIHTGKVRVYQNELRFPSSLGYVRYGRHEAVQVRRVLKRCNAGE